MSLLFCAVRHGQLGMHPVQCVLCHGVAQCRPMAPPRRWPWAGMATAARASWPEAVVHVRARVGDGVHSSTSRAARDIRSRRAHRAPALPPNMGSGPWRVASVLRLVANGAWLCVRVCVCGLVLVGGLQPRHHVGPVRTRSAKPHTQPLSSIEPACLWGAGACHRNSRMHARLALHLRAEPALWVGTWPHRNVLRGRRDAWVAMRVARLPPCTSLRAHVPAVKGKLTAVGFEPTPLRNGA